MDKNIIGAIEVELRGIARKAEQHQQIMDEANKNQDEMKHRLHARSKLLLSTRAEALEWVLSLNV